MKTGYAENYLYVPKCFEREISAYLYCYSSCMHILHTATQGPKSTNYLKQQEKVNDIYSDFGFVVWIFSPCFLKHGAVWVYQNSWLSFYSAVFNLAQWFRLLIVPHRNTILSSVTSFTWKEEHRTFYSVQTYQQLHSSCSSFSRTAFHCSLITFSYCSSINSRKKR